VEEWHQHLRGIESLADYLSRKKLGALRDLLQGTKTNGQENEI
jgi:hypothetical protein